MARRGGERRTGRRLKYQGGVHERNRLAGVSLSLSLSPPWMWSRRDDETVAGRARVQITRLPVQFCKTGFSCKISGQWASGSPVAAFSSSPSGRGTLLLLLLLPPKLRSIARFLVGGSEWNRTVRRTEEALSGRFLVIVLYLPVGAVAVAFAACLGFLYGLERGRSETGTRIPASDGQLSRSRPVSFPGPADNSIRSRTRVSNRFRDFFHYGHGYTGWFQGATSVSRVFETKCLF